LFVRVNEQENFLRKKEKTAIASITVNNQWRAKPPALAKIAVAASFRI